MTQSGSSEKLELLFLLPEAGTFLALKYLIHKNHINGGINMFDFHFSIPTEIYFGRACERKAGALMKQHADRVLLVYGSERIFRAENGQESLGAAIEADLQAAGCRVFKMGGVKPNADTAYIRQAVKLVRDEKINGVLAVGGGSVIDSAKAVSAGSGFDGDIMELYTDPNAQPTAFLPVGAVVTLPATASESNEMSVISDSATGKKIARPFPQVKPKFALLDPALTLSVSPFQTASGGFDIFAHAFERYFDLNRKSSLLDRMTIALMQEVVDVLPKVLADPQNEALRGELMLAATVAHNDMLGPGGDFACHEMSHYITEAFGVAHGAALAMILPAWCAYVSQKAPERFAEFFRQVFSIKECQPEAVIEQGIAALEAFIDSLGLSRTLTAERADRASLAEMAEKTMDGRSAIGWGTASLTSFDVAEIYERFILPVA